jgi:hypothetical protein
MMIKNSNFSKRYGFQPEEAEITVHKDAPHELRGVLVDIAYEAGLSPKPLRSLVCRVLRIREDHTNWSEYPNIDEELRYHLDDCEWFKVYDIIEELYETLRSRQIFARGSQEGFGYEYFETELNNCFRKVGIGWQLVDGKIQIRGPEVFEQAVNEAVEAIQAAGLQTASREIHEALIDLSRRPNSDITGALHHGMAALECVLREVSGDQKPTLGEILKRHSGLIPPSLDQCVEKAWGFASEQGRHLREGREPALEEAALVVGICGQVISYLTKKLPKV